MVGFVRDVTTDNPIPSSAYDISSVSITEAFSPLIGLNLAMKNSLSLKFEYRKQRNLALNVTSVQLSEGHTDEYVVGGGYTVKTQEAFDGGVAHAVRVREVETAFREFADVREFLACRGDAYVAGTRMSPVQPRKVSMVNRMTSGLRSRALNCAKSC